MVSGQSLPGAGMPAVPQPSANPVAALLRIEVLVCHTLANHYTAVPTRYRGAAVYGLLGPAVVERRRRIGGAIYGEAMSPRGRGFNGDRPAFAGDWDCTNRGAACSLHLP